ncbi:LysR family substrate-binding domain-containing protein, partial [Acinetobacter baumannii]|uniref:LysR family substrate-binding domain-containing protein n=1 Tax=Acinetobacter baumannii TaxID=470 RepID=UPI001370A874
PSAKGDDKFITTDYLQQCLHALIPRSFLTELIRHYREEHTGIEVEITEGTARDAVMQLRADQLDVVFVAGKPEMPDCHTRPIWTEPLVAVLSDGHRLAGQSAITWSDLVGETFIVRYGGTGPQGHCCKVSDEAAFCLIQRP